MNEIIDFLVRHWQLSATFVAVVVAYMVFELMQRTNNREVSTQQAIEMYNHQHGVLLDIRSEEAFNAGHIPGAVHVPQADVEAKIKQLNKYILKPVIVVCGAGKSAPKVAATLHAKGFEQAYCLAGGISGWIDSGLPLIKPEAANKAKRIAQD